MVDVTSIINSFGEEIFLLNLDPKSLRVYEKTDKITEECYANLGHLINSKFASVDSVLKFISNYASFEIDLMSDKLLGAINDTLVHFHNSVDMLCPNFDPENCETWNLVVTTRATQCLMHYPVYQREVQMQLNEGIVENSEIKDAVFNQMDENSILALYGLSTGHYPSSYDYTMRETIYQDAVKNGEKSMMGRVLMSSIRRDPVNMSALLESISVAKMKVLQSKQSIKVNEGKTLIFRSGNNKFTKINL